MQRDGADDKKVGKCLCYYFSHFCVCLCVCEVNPAFIPCVFQRRHQEHFSSAPVFFLYGCLCCSQTALFYVEVDPEHFKQAAPD